MGKASRNKPSSQADKLEKTGQQAEKRASGQAGKLEGMQAGKLESGQAERQSGPEAGTAHRSRSALLLPVLVIAFVSCAVYFNALSNDFVYDDKAQVLDNRWIRDAKHIPAIFTESVWGFVRSEDEGTSNYYRPLMHLFYMACYYLFGLKPWGFHLINVLFHAGASVLVFLVLLRLLAGSTLTGETGGGIQSALDSKDTGQPFYSTLFTIHYSLLSAFIAAILFAVHPIHTEAVTWVAALPEVAFTFFFLLSFHLYMGYREEQVAKNKESQESFSKKDSVQAGMTSRSNLYYALSLVSFSASVFFKEPALTLPVILMAYDFAFSRGKIVVSQSLMRYIPYFTVAAIYLLLRLNALKGMAPSETYTLTGPQYIINVFPLFVKYLQDLLLPFSLNFWHSFHPLDSLFNAGGLFSLFVTIAFAAALVMAWKKNKPIFLGLLFILLPLLPAFYIKGIGGKPYAERYLYLPSVGFFIVISFFLAWLMRRSPRHRVLASLVMIITAVFYSAQTIQRNTVYKNDFTLFEDTLKKSPDAVPIYNTYAVALADAGRFDEAIGQYQAALNAEPDNFKTHINIAVAYGKKGAGNEALEHLLIALKMSPYDPTIHNNLGNAYAITGAMDKAIGAWQRAAELLPDYYEPYFNLGKTYEQQGLYEKAVREYETAVRLKPDYIEAHYNLGRTFLNMGRRDDAIAQLKIVISLSPENATYHNTLGFFYVQKGSFDDAIRQFEEAVRLAPNKPSYRENLERAVRQRSEK